MTKTTIRELSEAELCFVSGGNDVACGAGGRYATGGGSSGGYTPPTSEERKAKTIADLKETAKEVWGWFF